MDCSANGKKNEGRSEAEKFRTEGKTSLIAFINKNNTTYTALCYLFSCARY
jgi:hypothetical protein